MSIRMNHMVNLILSINIRIDAKVGKCRECVRVHWETVRRRMSCIVINLQAW